MHQGPVFDSNGKPSLYNGSKADFVVNTNPGFIQYAPEVEALSNGGFVITFSGSAVENGFANHDIGMRVFTSNGPAGLEGIISDASSHNPGSSSITRLNDGRYVVAWTANQDTTNVVARSSMRTAQPAATLSISPPPPRALRLR